MADVRDGGEDIEQDAGVAAGEGEVAADDAALSSAVDDGEATIGEIWFAGEEGPEVGGSVVRVGHDLAEQHPASVVAARGEAPATADLVPAVDRRRLTGGRVRGGDPGRLIGTPDLLLRLGREQAHVPGMHAEDGGDPACGAAGTGDQPYCRVEGKRFCLKSPES